MERVNQILSENKLPIGLSLIGLVLIMGGIFSSGIYKSTSPKTTFPQESIVKAEEINSFKVDISGAVNAPGVYSLGSTSRIEDAIRAAQGFSPKVNKEFISKSLNLSQKISDGQKIYIPFQGEQGVVMGVSAASATTTSGKVGLNSGSIDQLNSLPGVGDVTSNKIIAGRPYTTIDDLINKKVVSKSVFSKIKDLVDLN